MDDLIYLLLFVAWIAFAIYRNNQKKKLREQQRAKAASGEPEEVPEKSPGSLLEEILLGEESIEVQEEPLYGLEDTDRITAKEPVFQQREEPRDFDDEYNLRGITSIEELDLKTGKEKSEKGKIELESILVLDFEESENEPLEFDLRKAVIYSEILNRRYF
jgi:hypothetical protein